MCSWRGLEKWRWKEWDNNNLTTYYEMPIFLVLLGLYVIFIISWHECSLDLFYWLSSYDVKGTFATDLSSLEN
jgi:hypothetical protein